MRIAVIHGRNHKGSTRHIADERLKNIGAAYEVKEFFCPETWVGAVRGAAHA